ncbi:hypothetical protein EW146_g6818 [Bondarzewia mesenterica]|uniref:Histone deacetylase domain-containing protein n=1 Tax=Bondarzewia mesenterica TaxID=1095465 RepID=A0A4V3XEG6_9AGAM|nr:hypothetical protein EW146_g6818 [Bondarzewia mesenterica]
MQSSPFTHGPNYNRERAEGTTEARAQGYRVIYVASERLAKISSLLPSNRNRSSLVHSLVASLGLLRPIAEKNTDLEYPPTQVQVLRPSLATSKELSAYHDKEYVDFLLDSQAAASERPLTFSVAQVELRDSFGLEDDCPPFRGLSDYVQHHAHKSHASGFCYVNDCVLAVLTLKRASCLGFSDTMPSRKPRIMYLDLDLHFSDGVSSAFHTSAPASSKYTPQILTLSIHHASPGFFPPSPISSLPNPVDPTFDPFTLSLPLSTGASNATFARIWSSVVEKLKDAFDPDFIVLQCGVDGLAGDPCKVWNWGLDGKGGMGWCVEKVVRGWGKKVLMLGGGGYNAPNAARAWAYFTSIARGQPLSLETPIPDHNAFPLYAPSFTLDSMSLRMLYVKSRGGLRIDVAHKKTHL